VQKGKIASELLYQIVVKTNHERSFRFVLQVYQNTITVTILFFEVSFPSDEEPNVFPVTVGAYQCRANLPGKNNSSCTNITSFSSWLCLAPRIYLDWDGDSTSSLCCLQSHIYLWLQFC